jgi:predicted metalloprotease with PDZ domain
MPERSSTNPKAWWLRPALVRLAAVFAVVAVLYSTLWMLSNWWVPDVDLGFDNSPSFVVSKIEPDGPAEKAGLLKGDRLLTIDGNPLEGVNSRSVFSLYKPHKPGDSVELTIARPGQASPLVLTATFRRRGVQPQETGWAGSLAELLRNTYPVPFVIAS